MEGCGKDLGGLSTYHQRCRICEVHIKEPRFLRAGLVQRFCQQCGRWVAVEPLSALISLLGVTQVSTAAGLLDAANKLSRI